MRFKLIACKALFREISYLCARNENFIDVTFLRQGFHDIPKMLTKTLQDEIDRVESGDDIYTYKSRLSERDFDAILLGYGLCSNGAVTLHSKKYPIIIPRVHDCISLILGSKELYDKEFSANPGTYWYTPSWIENASVPSRENEKELKAAYAEEYGEENADYLYDMEMLHNYSRCAYVKWDELEFPQYEEFTRRAADDLNWEFSVIKGRPSLLEDLLSGNWDDERFLRVEPGRRIIADYDGNIMSTEDM